LVNKRFIADSIAENFELTKGTASRIVDMVFSTMEVNLQLGQEIDINGFGRFSVTERDEREARNPRTGEPITVPAKKAVKFKPSKTLKDVVNTENTDPVVV
jgi:DNA-binding protein HU-beta